MKQSVTVGAQLLWSGRYGCNNGRYGCTIVMSYIEINKAVSQWLLTFNLCVSVTWPLTCAFHIPCTHTPESIDMHRGVCDKTIDDRTQLSVSQFNINHILSFTCWILSRKMKMYSDFYHSSHNDIVQVIEIIHHTSQELTSHTSLVIWLMMATDIDLQESFWVWVRPMRGGDTM